MKVDFQFGKHSDRLKGIQLWDDFNHAVEDYEDYFNCDRQKFVCYMHPEDLGCLVTFLAKEFYVSQLEMLGKDQDFVRIGDVKVFEGYEREIVFKPDYFHVGPGKFDDLIKKYSTK